MADSTEDDHARGRGMPERARKTLTQAQVLLIAKALADRRRYEILRHLGECRDAVGCGAVRGFTRIEPSTLSRYMKELQAAGLAEVVRKGKFAKFLLRRGVIEAFLHRIKKDVAH